jgi:hypothetical protein
MGSGLHECGSFVGDGVEDGAFHDVREGEVGDVEIGWFEVQF